MHSISVVCLSAILAAGAVPQKTVTKSDMVEATATVQAIDSTNRIFAARTGRKT